MIADLKDTQVSPCEALANLIANLAIVPKEIIPCKFAAGRILAESVVAVRPSPPCNTSAMDGYALHLSEDLPYCFEVCGEVAIGKPPVVLPNGKALRIVTGAPIPQGADIVVKHEDVVASDIHIKLSANLIKKLSIWQNIRRAGENLRAGYEAVGAGIQITPAVISVLAGLNKRFIAVYRKVRVAIVVSGDELLEVGQTAQSWQIFDSNGPALHAILEHCPWIEIVCSVRLPDNAASIRDSIADLQNHCDAVLVTGGVSVGPYDYVPDAMSSVGAEIIFQKLPIRPGHPLLGAVGSSGQLHMGLPGNPVAVLTTARRFAAIALTHMSGQRSIAPAPLVNLNESETKQSLDMWWYRPARIMSSGLVALVPNNGSGDFVAAARSDGFIEMPPNATGSGPWSFYTWNI